MNRHESLKPITRRALRINYRAPLICMEVIESGSGSAVASTVSFVPVTRAAGTELKACPTNEGTIILDWLAIQNVFAYVVYRSTSADGVFTVVASGGTATIYTDTPDAPGTYYYRVTGLEPNFGETEASNIVSATI